MNKVIAVFDDVELSESTLDYAIYLANHFNAHIVAAFSDGDRSHHLRPATNEDCITVSLYQTNTVRLKNDRVSIALNKKLQTKFDAAAVHYNIRTNKLLGLNTNKRKLLCRYDSDRRKG